ncbi:hypothetical protein HPB48_010154 [Haemaphysalis longicornis]|uniref:Endonuclease/exonuclease/phosphatase domain-containing protein n=1 Tax=Haemaphysalis longicornis TaxID=44386 RepID=A0A9J6FX10_HAELO|nr:hypothetical protein HPB48_010154 [Haemaphysalis longicornis]
MPWQKMGPPNKNRRNRGETVVWQWNCRGFREKRAELIQYITTQEKPPHVTALQETNSYASLPGYITFHADGTRVLHTLVPRSVTAIQHPLPLAGAPGILLELLPAKGSKNSSPIFHLNVYCRPKRSPQALNDTLEVARKKAGRHQLIVSGDFNVAHPLWGYAYANPRGKYLHKYIDDKAWVILNELNIPTRTGTSTCHDTTPDLSLSNKQVTCVWRNKQEALGSDHSIIENVISGPELVRTVGRASLTDWVGFRKMRSSRHTEDIPDPMEEDQYSAWITQLIQDQATCTTKLHTSTDNPCMDTHLLHIWEARRSLQKRWKKQRHNRKLRQRIAQLTENAANYARELCRESWLSLCDAMDNHVSTSKTWKILRYNSSLPPGLLYLEDNVTEPTTVPPAQALNRHTSDEP